jgi:hypothetical protein
VINPILDLGCSKLNELRQIKPDAAGLVVATDIEHAQQVALALEAMGEECRIVTNKTPDAQQVINAFRSSACRWIVAVGMISEGTDIPRLQVCCYLSRIRTELHYRQVLGRVLRRTGESDDRAWLFMLAEPTLQGFAERIADDLPDDLAVLSDAHMPSLTPGSRPDRWGTLGHAEGIGDVGFGGAEPNVGSQAMNIISLGGFAIEPAYCVSFLSITGSSFWLVFDARPVEAHHTISVCMNPQPAGAARNVIERCVWKLSRRHWSMSLRM